MGNPEQYKRCVKCGVSIATGDSNYCTFCEGSSHAVQYSRAFGLPKEILTEAE